MFTIRFIKNGGKGHRSYSCSEYETTIRDEFIEVRMVLKCGTEIDELVGAGQDYELAYVTNEAGRTIDKVTL